MDTTELVAQLVAGGTPRARAEELLGRMGSCSNDADRQRTWIQLSRQVLSPRHAFDLHLELYRHCYQSTTLEQPVWIPDPIAVEQTNIKQSMRELGFREFETFRQWSIDDRERFWGYLVERLKIQFFSPFERILDDSDPRSPSWLVGSRINIVESCFGRAHDHDVAIIYGSPEADPMSLARTTYAELRQSVARVANGLRESGLQPGEAVGLVLSMSPQSVAVYLGIIAAGGVVVSVAESFSAAEIATRFQIANVTRVFTQSILPWGGKRLPIYEKLISVACPPAIVIGTDQLAADALRAGDMDFADFLSGDTTLVCHPCDPHQPIHVLFSSGTTADPKAIPWDHTTPIKCAADAFFHHNLQPGDVTCWPTSLGWMMGPWLIFATLMNRGAMALFPEMPAGEAFGRFVQDAKVTILGTVPSLVRRWREEDCMRAFNWSAIQVFSSTGECSNPEDMFYLTHLAGYRPIIEYCGGTEIGGGYVTGTVVQPCILSTFSTPALGIDFSLRDDDGRKTEHGEVFIEGVSIGLSTRLLNRDHEEVYFAGTPEGKDGLPLRRHGDELSRQSNGYYRVVGRSDDAINLGGIKVGCAEIERVINRLEEVQESAALAVASETGGPSRLILFVVPSSGTDLSAATFKPLLQEAIKIELNPLFHVAEVRLIEAMPRTASNKIMRRKLRERL